MNRYQSTLAPINDENVDIILPIPPSKQFVKNHQSPNRQNFTRSIPSTSRKINYSRPSTSKQAISAASRANSMKNFTPQIKKSASVVLIGDSNCGKTSLVLTYLNKKVSTPPKSVLFETYDKTIGFQNNLSVDLQIWDFPGDEYFDRFRPLAYANAKGVLICFTLDRIESLHNIEERWIPELETHCPNAVKIIVGLGSEVRFDKTKIDQVPAFDYCYKIAKKLGCRYMECSIVDKESYTRIFEQLAILSTALEPSQIQQNLLQIPKTRTNTMIKRSDSDDEQAKELETSPNNRVSSYHKRKTFIGCTII